MLLTLTYVSLIPRWPGMKMQKTEMLMQVMKQIVVMRIFFSSDLSVVMIAIRLMMIWRMNWIWTTQRTTGWRSAR